MLRHWMERLTFGCRRYFRLLPVVTRDVTLLLLVPDSGPDAVRFGESSSFTAVLVCCGGVGSGLEAVCDLSFLYSAMARCNIYRSGQQSLISWCGAGKAAARLRTYPAVSQFYSQSVAVITSVCRPLSPLQEISSVQVFFCDIGKDVPRVEGF